MWGRLGSFEQLLVKIEAEHETLRRVLGAGKLISAPSGGSLRRMRELNDEAQALIDKLRGLRRNLRTAHDRFRYFGPRDGYEAIDLQDDIAARVAMLREQADRIAAELRDSATRKT